MSKYFLDFENRDDLVSQFDTDTIPSEDEILFASYAPGCYCGDAVVIFKRNNILYMVEASHCSCYGLEGQWGPNEIDAAQLLTYQLGRDHTDEVIAAFTALAHLLNNVQ